MTHRLDTLLRPRSIAVLGATERAGTVGRTSVENLLKGRFEGPLYAVNPKLRRRLRRALLPDARRPAPTRRARDLRRQRRAARSGAR